MRAVVDRKSDPPALTIVEQRRKLQDVADSGPAKAVQTLVVVADHTQIAMLTGQQEKDAFLNGVGVLVFVHHQVSELLA